MSITAIIIAQNEEQTISSCLKNVAWTDEQIVVNNDSNDQTAQIATNLGATVINVSGKDFSRLRNEGAKRANAEWLLYIDTDEEITSALQKEILSVIQSFNQQEQPHGYVIKRINYFLGRKWPTEDGMIRLIYKPSLIEWFGALHETAKIDGVVSELKERLIHRTHNDLTEMVEKTNQWSAIEAKLRYDAHHAPIVPWRIIRVVLTGFINSYINNGGWRAGTEGFIESIYQGFSLFITYAKLWELQQKK